MRRKSEQIRLFVKTIIFFTLLGVNLYLNCQYLKVIHKTEHMSGMMLGVFLLQLLCFLLFFMADLWLHNYKSRMTAILVLAVTTLVGTGYYLYCEKPGGLQIYDANEGFLYLFGLFQSILFIYLLLAAGISHFIKRINKNTLK